MNMKQFAAEIIKLSQEEHSPIQRLPMRVGDISQGCVVRFKIGTAF